MGLLTDIQEALTEAFNDDLSDVVSGFVLVKKKIGSYDVSLGKRAEVESRYDGRGVFSSFGANEIDGTNIKSEDEKLIVNGADLSINPNVDDVIVIASSKEYIVINSTPIMGGETTPIVYIIQIRKDVNQNV